MKSLQQDTEFEDEKEEGTMLIVKNGRVITRDAAHPYYKDGAVVIDGEQILEVGACQDLEKKYPKAETIDAKGGLIMPGFINAHTHIYSGLARGLSVKGYNPTNFYEILDGMWWAIDRKLDLDLTRASAYVTILECLTWCEKENSDMIKAMFGGHALFTISDKTFEKMVEANDGRTGFHIHVAEGMNDVWDSLQNYGTRPVERLLNNNILGKKTLLGHCIHLSGSEMDIIRETGTMVVNNPESNMGNAVGCAPVLQMMKKGILVGMGTDAYTHDMLESLKVFLIIQRHNAEMPNVAWGEDMKMLFENNREIAGRYFKKPVGILKAGAAADVIVMDYDPFTPISNENIDGHLLFGMNGHNCRTTIINGKVLYKDRAFVGIDEEKINAFSMEQACRLWGSLNETSYNPKDYL